MCFLLYEQGELPSIGPLADRAWRMAEEMGAAGTLARLCWLAGDLAITQGDYEAAGEAYYHACLYARQFGPELEQATAERIRQRSTQLEAAAGQEAVARFRARTDDIV